MPKYTLLLLLLLASLCACRTSNSSIHPQKVPVTNRYNVIAYVAGWSILPISRMEVEKLTHINYAFANLDSVGNVFFSNANDSTNIVTLQQLRKKANPDLKIIVSIGGWTWSKHFSTVASTQALRSNCAASIASFVKQHKLDGIDIDWEYPCMRAAGNSFSPDDKQNFTLLLHNIRTALSKLELSQKRATPYILSIAVATSSNYLKSIEPLKVLEYVDFMHIMTYDYRSGDSWETGHHSNLWVSLSDWNNGNCIDKTITLYLAAGIPANRLIMGVPFYGRKWDGVNKQNNGLYQVAKTSGQSISYRSIRTTCTPQNGYINIWDDSAQAPYLWNPNEGIFISYESPQSLRYKVDYIKQKNIGGIMFWEYTGDYNSELLNSITNYLKTDRYVYIKRQNTLITISYLTGIHPAILAQLPSFENEYGTADLSTPRFLFGSANMSIVMLAPFINLLWLNQFIA